MFFTEPSSKACTASGLPDGSPDRLDVERPRQSAAMSGADCQLEKQGTARRTWSRNFGVGAAQDGAGLPEIIAKSMWQHRHEQHCQSSCRPHLKVQLQRRVQLCGMQQRQGAWAFLHRRTRTDTNSGTRYPVSAARPNTRLEGPPARVPAQPKTETLAPTLQNRLFSRSLKKVSEHHSSNPWLHPFLAVLGFDEEVGDKVFCCCLNRVDCLLGEFRTVGAVPHLAGDFIDDAAKILPADDELLVTNESQVLFHPKAGLLLGLGSLGLLFCFLPTSHGGERERARLQRRAVRLSKLPRQSD